MADTLPPLKDPSAILTLADSLENEARHADVAEAVRDEITVLYCRTMLLTAATLRDLLARVHAGETDHPPATLASLLRPLASLRGSPRVAAFDKFREDVGRLDPEERHEISVVLAGLATIAHPRVPTSARFERPIPPDHVPVRIPGVDPHPGEEA